MDFGFTPEQEQFLSSVRDFLAAQAPVSYARSMMEDPLGHSGEVWRRTAELGWQGLTIPERFGGSGLGILDLLLALESMGEVAFPGPYFSTMVLGVSSLLLCGSEDQLSRVLPEVAAGECKLAVAVAEAPGLWNLSGIAMSARRDGADFVLDGEKLFVGDVASADSLIVVCRLDDGLGFFILPRDSDGLCFEEMITVDRTRRLFALSLSQVRVDANSLLGGCALGEDRLDRLIDIAKAATAAEMCGCARRALDLSVEYAKIREQFDRPIGSFQAIQHRCADMKVDLENAKSLSYYAGWALDEDAGDAHLAAAMAKAYASEACTRIVADAIQIHGGIGFTWEHDLHLYFKRVKAGEVSYGDASFNREVVAQALALG